MANDEDASDLYGAEHVRQYRETDGEYGHDWKRGSPSAPADHHRPSAPASPARPPLIYGRSGEDYLVVASERRLRTSRRRGTATSRES